MRTEYKNNRKHVICDNLSEFFTEFKKYQAKKSNIATKENYSKHVFPYLEGNKEASQGNDTWKLFLVDLDYEEPKTQPFWSLGLDISPSNIKGEVSSIESEGGKKERKIREILHEIGEKGSANNSSLDLKGPNNEKDKENPTSSLSETSNKEKMFWGISGGVIFIAFVLFLIYLFSKREKTRK